jgi:hypothetical protein
MCYGKPTGTCQEEDLQYNSRDLYSPILKSAEVSLAAQHGAMFKTDMTEAFPYCDVVDDLYVLLPDWWQKQGFQRDTAPNLRKTSTEHGRRLEHGISVAQDGWSRTNTRP